MHFSFQAPKGAALTEQEAIDWCGLDVKASDMEFGYFRQKGRLVEWVMRNINQVAHV